MNCFSSRMNCLILTMNDSEILIKQTTAAHIFEIYSLIIFRIRTKMRCTFVNAHCALTKAQRALTKAQRAFINAQ